MDLTNLEYMLNIPPLMTDDLARNLSIGPPPALLPTADFRSDVLSHLQRRGAPDVDLESMVLDRDPFLPLGRRFERLAEVSLALGFPHHELKANVQLPSKPTPGELDFLVMSETEILHIEVAVKFYLFVPPQPGQAPSLACFHGPQRKDRLDLKLRKIFHQQIRHEIPDAFRLRDGKPRTVARALWLCGRLFYPWEGSRGRNRAELNLGLNPQHHSGWWLTAGQLRREMPRESFVVLPKPQWIQPWSTIGQSDSARTIHGADDFVAIEKPQALLRLSASGEEIDRGFVVPESWMQAEA